MLHTCLPVFSNMASNSCLHILADADASEVVAQVQVRVCVIYTVYVGLHNRCRCVCVRVGLHNRSHGEPMVVIS